MDNDPLSHSSPEPESPLPDEAKPDEIESNKKTSLPPCVSPASSSPLPSGRERQPLWRDGFIGRPSIYQGACWLIYLTMAWFVFQVEGWLVSSFRSDLSLLWWRLTIEGSMMVAAILPGFVMARIEGKPFGNFGLPAQRAFRRNFWVGILWGIASLSVLILLLRVTGAFQFGSLSLHGPRIFKFAAYYAALFLLTGFFEEFLVRGYSQWALTRVMSFWPAAAFLSVGFGYLHGANPGESKTGLVAAGLIGFFLCLTLRRTGDLWWAVGFHMAWDWGESYLYSVPDSGALLPGHLLNSSFHGPDWLTGGSVGPEGSCLVFVVIGALWVLFDRAYPEVKYDAK